jgi:MFS family permease
LIAFGLLLIATTMQAGFALAGSSFAESIFMAQTNWTDMDQTIITSCATLGLAVGSLGSAALLKKGRRLTILIGNVIVLISFGFQLKISVILISIGKFLQGLGSGMILNAASIMSAETVPTEYAGGFGALINLGVVVGLSTYMFLSMLVPTDPVELETTQIWKYLFALPSILAVILLILYLFIFKQDSIVFHVAQNQHDQAL